MERLKVLFTIDSLGTGGTETSTLDVLKCLPNSIQPSLCYFHNKTDLLGAAKALNMPIHYLPLQGHNDWLDGSKQLASLISQHNYDAVISTLFEANIVSRLACRKTRTPLIGTFVTDSYGAVRKNAFKGFNRLKFLYTLWLDKLTARIPLFYISNGQYIAAANAKHLNVPLSRVRVLYRGRRVELFPAWQPPSDDKFSFITIARLVENKGLIELIQAFARLHNMHPHTKLMLVGDGPLRERLIQLVKDHHLEEHVDLLLNLPNAYNQLYRANAFVLATWFEGFSGALIEAMLSGVPVIASDIPMNAEAIRHGKNGFLFKVRSVDSLVAAMSNLLTHYNSAVQCGKLARQEALVKFDSSKRSDIYANWLREAAGSK